MPKVEYQPWMRWQSLAAVEIRQDDEMSSQFEVLAVIAEQEAELYFLDHLTRVGREKGMEDLPKGVQGKDRVRVSLKP